MRTLRDLQVSVFEEIEKNGFILTPGSMLALVKRTKRPFDEKNPESIWLMEVRLLKINLKNLAGN